MCKWHWQMAASVQFNNLSRLRHILVKIAIEPHWLNGNHIGALKPWEIWNRHFTTVSTKRINAVYRKSGNLKVSGSWTQRTKTRNRCFLLLALLNGDLRSRGANKKDCSCSVIEAPSYNRGARPKVAPLRFSLHRYLEELCSTHPYID